MDLGLVVQGAHLVADHAALELSEPLQAWRTHTQLSMSCGARGFLGLQGLEKAVWALQIGRMLRAV